ncbi:hypothetical protein WJX74_000272 [Apatococcus lobatus]|uniref:VTT domain-containing protein n=1 Tax=Apatococcus lobatus TaxID=904363 RepID=A0AAW1QDD1_9CHLO
MPEALDRLSLLAEANGQQLPSLATARGSEYDPDLESPTVLPHNPDAPSEGSPSWQKPTRRRGPLDVAQAAPGIGRAKWLLRLVLGNWEKLLVAAVLIALVVLVSVKGLKVLGDILHWFEKRNNWVGWSCFLLLYCVDVALFLPGLVLILAAGFVFGFWKGFLAVWAGGSVGQALAFLLARHLLRDWVAGFLRGRWRNWEVVDKAMELEGWKLLLLVRLSPIVPYNLLNIAMATTPIHFWQFAFVSAIGIIPECALLSYFGSFAENMTQIMGGGAGPHGLVTYLLGGLSLISLVIAACWATILVRRAITRAEVHLRNERHDSGLEILDQAGRRKSPSRGSSRFRRAISTH